MGNRASIYSRICLLFMILAGVGLCSHNVSAAKGQIACYDFHDTQSKVIEDVSGCGNDAVVRNYQDGKFSIVSDTIHEQKVNTAVLSGGKGGSYLELPGNIFEGCTAFTAVAWVKLTGTGKYQRIWDFGNDQLGYIYLLSDGNNENAIGYTAAVTTQGWQNEKTVSMGSDFPRNEWFFTAMSMEGDVLTLYLNGEKIGSCSTGISFSQFSQTRHNYLGGSQFVNDVPPAGAFAECSLFNYALSEEEIRNYYDQVVVTAVTGEVSREDALYNYYLNYGENPEGAMLPGEENPNSNLRGLVLGHYLSDLADACKEDASYTEQIREVVQELLRLQAKSSQLGWGEGYLSCYSPDDWVALYQGKCYPEVGMPLFENGMLLKGLLEIYDVTGLEESLQTAENLAQWLYAYIEGYTQEDREKLWEQHISGDSCGIGNSMVELYEITGDARYRDYAQAYVVEKLFTQWNQEEYILVDNRVSIVLEQAVLYIKLAESEEERVDRMAVINSLWKKIVQKHCFAAGMVGYKGYFVDSYTMIENANRQTTGYEEDMVMMLRLTQLLNELFDGHGDYMDYYQKTMYNLYALQTDMAADAVFRETDDATYVEIYVPGKYTDAHGYTYTQTVDMEAGRIQIEVGAEKRDTCRMGLRIPGYAHSSFKIEVNGKERGAVARNGYYMLDGMKAGDVITIEVAYEFSLGRSLERRTDYQLLPVMYGPFCLCRTDEYTADKIRILQKDMDDLQRKEGDSISVSWQGSTFLPYYRSLSAQKVVYYRIFLQKNENEKWYYVDLEQPDTTKGILQTDRELVEEGGTVTIIAYPREGYQVTDVKVNGEQLQTDEKGNYVLTDVCEDIKVTGRFQMINPQTPNPKALEQTAVVTAHATASWENIEGVKDESFQPESSNEGMGHGWGDWYQTPGTEVWIQYAWEVEIPMNTCEIYWYDDQGGTGTPGTLAIEYLDENDQWQEVERQNKEQKMFKLDQYNVIEFETVTTRVLRLRMTVADDRQAVGIYRWKVSNR